MPSARDDAIAAVRAASQGRSTGMPVSDEIAALAWLESLPEHPPIDVTFQQRCERAAVELDRMADDRPGVAERSRLVGKAQGVRLAVSYLRDYRPFAAAEHPPTDDEATFLRVWEAVEAVDYPPEDGYYGRVARAAIAAMREAPDE